MKKKSGNRHMAMHFAKNKDRSIFSGMVMLYVFYLVTLSGCRHVNPWPGLVVPDIGAFDTLSFAADEDWNREGRKKIPNADFFQSVPREFLEEISEFVDTAACQVYPRGKLILDERYDGYWIDIRYMWFIQQSLWIFDKAEHRFSDRLTLASWYGGEGGQIRVATWLWYSGKKLQILERQQEHGLLIEEEAIRSQYMEDVALWEFESGIFYALPLKDSALWIQKFQLQGME
jgi:hypothetical protein